jgi:hypothetical protein
MDQPQQETVRVSRPLAAILILAGAIPVLMLGYTVGRRIAFEYEFNHVESSMLIRVDRILDGRPLYAAPSIDYATIMYPPFYYYAASMPALALGPKLIALRLVTAVAIAAILIYVFLFVFRETRSMLFGLAAVGLYASFYAESQGLLDVGRPDTLMTAFLLAALYHSRDLESKRAVLLVAVCWLLGFHTKQSMLPLTAPIGLYWLAVHRLRGLALIGVLAVVGGLLTAWLSWRTNGWYFYYVFWRNLYAEHDNSMFLTFFTRDLLKPFPIAVALCVAYLLVLMHAHAWKRFGYYGAILAGVILGTAMLRTHIGSSHGGNIVLALHAVLAVCASLGLYAVWKTLKGGIGSRKSLRWTPAAVWSVLAGAQMLLVWYRPSDFLPTPETEQAWQQLEAKVAAIPGDVYLARHNFIALRAGKNSYAHPTDLQVIFTLRDTPQIKQDIDERFREAIASRRFAAWLLHEDYFRRRLRDLGLHDYYVQSEIFETRPPKSNAAAYMGPVKLYLPRPDAPDEDAGAQAPP